VTSTEESRYTL